MVLARLSLNNMRIIWKNFSGKPDIYNSNGVAPNFHFVIEPEMAQDMQSKGWPVKEHQGKDGNPYWTMKCQVGKFEKPIFLVNIDTGAMVPLAMESLKSLDNCLIDHVDADVSLTPWTKGSRSGVSVYLNGMNVYKSNDRFTDGYERWKAENQTPPPAEPEEDDGNDLPF